jgi:uncharacterized protein (UPF0332 family)
MDLARHRLDVARECLRDAEQSISFGSFAASANRSYYCVFHAMRAVLALDGFDSKKHSGIISEFQRCYIKKGIFPTRFSSLITSAFNLRNKSDYEDFYIASKEEVQHQIEIFG